ncbi:MAG: hypothetical protein HC846_10835 [Blastocatellia bacterium]|nr:hypothetical protein [Blastocatellia bacterium]
MPVGYFSLILHAHLPFVRHPEYPEFLEEDWLYEAITEVYLPLIVSFQNHQREGIKSRLAMNVSPPLCEMLADPLLQTATRIIGKSDCAGRKRGRPHRKRRPGFLRGCQNVCGKLKRRP